MLYSGQQRQAGVFLMKTNSPLAVVAGAVVVGTDANGDCGTFRVLASNGLRSQSPLLNVMSSTAMSLRWLEPRTASITICKFDKYSYQF